MGESFETIAFARSFRLNRERRAAHVPNQDRRPAYACLRRCSQLYCAGGICHCIAELGLKAK